MTINDPDAGVAPSVAIAGEDGGFSQVLSASADLSVAPDTYLVTAGPLRTPDPIVGLEFLAEITGSPALVTSGQTSSVVVNYAARPGTGLLWAPGHADGNVYGFASADLVDGATPNPAWTLTTDAGEFAEAVAFDPAGKLWADIEYSQVWGWTLFPDAGASDPVVIDFDPQLGIEVQSITFAPNGDLWVVDATNRQLVRLTPDQLLASNTATPASTIPVVTVDDAGLDSLDGPYGVAFDSAGNAWVGNEGNNTIAEFAALGDGGYDSYPATFIVPDANGDLNGPNGLSFDSQGRLWVAAAYSDEVLRLDVAGLSGVLEAAPATVIQDADGGTGIDSLSTPDYVSFDQSGALWVFNQNTSTFVRYTDPGSLSGVVAPLPERTINTSLAGDTGKFQFDPPAPGLGLFP